MNKKDPGNIFTINIMQLEIVLKNLPKFEYLFFKETKEKNKLECINVRKKTGIFSFCIAYKTY